MLPYIINVALVLATCLAFYKLLLRRETFYSVNRFLLIACLAVSFLLPLLQVPSQFSFHKNVSTQLTVDNKQLAIDTKQSAINPEQPATGSTKPATANPQPETSTRQNGFSFSFAQLVTWLFWFYWFGVIIFAISFLFQIGLLLWRAWRNPVILDGRYRIVEVSGDKAPCSFGNNIFINPAKYDWDTYNQVLLHEKIHIREKHTLDILIAELVLIFQWFNPFAWIYRREVESNLEFLTDDQLMQKEKMDKKAYQLSLVKVSAPHFPLSVTTNYNQSILKKRIAMMNSKRSNLHTAWKYFFLLPVLAFLACVLNEPVATAQSTKPGNENTEVNDHHHGMETEGYWFAVIKDDKVNIHFSDEKLDGADFESHSNNSSTFKLSELGTLPKGTQGTFNISREAGRMEMTGKFENNMGMGTYKFVADKNYVDYMNKELSGDLDANDQLAFFFINIKKDYLQMLKKEGFTNITKDDIIPMAAMQIDEAYISSIKNSGFKDVSMQKLIPLKAMGINEKYITDIRGAGYKDVTADQLIAFKAQGIDKDYIVKVKQMKGDEGKMDTPDDIVSYKVMNITPEYANSFKAVGLTNINHEQLLAFKSMGVTPEYVRSWREKGFTGISPDEFVGMKSQDITSEYMQEFIDMGYKDVKPENLVGFKAMGVTPGWIRSFEDMGYKNIKFDEFTALKSQDITPEFIKSFEAVGFKNVNIEDIVAVKAMGVTPEYIKDMKAKGFNYNSLQKYITLKSLD